MLVYGYKVADDDDLLIKIVTEAMDNFGEVTQSGAFAVDFFPLRKAANFILCYLNSLIEIPSKLSLFQVGFLAQVGRQKL